MLIKDVISRIKSLYNKGAASDDSRLSNRHVYSKIRSVRALLLKRQLEKKSTKVSPWNTQVISCLQMIPVDPSSCDCVVSDGCKLLRSKCKIPVPLNVDFGYGAVVENVSTIDGSVIFSPTTWAKKKYKSGNKYTASQSDYFIRENYIYITHNTLLERISLSGIFEDPYLIDVFNANGDCTCQGSDDPVVDPCVNPMYSEIAVDEWLIEPLIELSMKELIQIFSAMPEDKDNDASTPNVTSSPSA